MWLGHGNVVARVPPLGYLKRQIDNTREIYVYIDELDPLTRRMVSDAGKLILSSGAVHINMADEQKEAFLKAMLGILR